MTSDVGSSHLLEFAFWALWVTAVLRNILSKDPMKDAQTLCVCCVFLCFMYVLCVFIPSDDKKGARVCVLSVCVYYCRTYDKAVCGGGGGQ